MNKPLSLIGVPLDLGAESLGVANGPQVFRNRNIVEKLTTAGLQVTDNQDVPCTSRDSLVSGNPLLPYVDEIVRVNEVLAAHVAQTLTSGQSALVLGGDHSVNLGAFAGAASATKGNIGLIYIDAHGDINTPETSLSHNIHGMHLAALMGFGAPELVQCYGQAAKLKKENLVHIAASDLDEGEEEMIASQKLQFYRLFDVLSHGLAPLWRLIDDLCCRVDAIWVSVDLDAIDAVYAPGVGIPNQGGLSYREIAAICEYIGKKCPVVGADIVEYNPSFDKDFKTAELGIEIAAKLLGKNYSWYTNYMERQK